MRLEISKGVAVWLEQSDLDFLRSIPKDGIGLDGLEESEIKRLQKLVRKDIIRRSNREGKAIYEVRRDIPR